MPKEINNNTIGNIMLIKSSFQQEQMEKAVDNFSGVPMSTDSPFVEIIWDPVRYTLAIISKIKKESFHFLPKLNGSGIPLPNNNKQSAAQVPYQQERVLIETFHEYFIEDLDDVKKFLTVYAYNQDFDWDAFVGKKKE